MDIAWLMGIGAGVCNAGVAVAGKGAERSRCRPAAYGLVAFAVAGVTAFLTVSGSEAVWSDWRLWAFGCVMGALYLAGISVALSANRFWPPSIVWSTANMAFVVPILLSALFLGESLRWMDAPIAAGVALMLAGLADKAALGGDGATPAPQRIRWALLASIFVINGLVMLGFKLFGILLPGQRPACAVAAFYGCAAILAVLFQAARGGIGVTRVEVRWGLAAGITFGLAALAVLGSMRLPAAAAFPVIQGASLVGGVLLCALVFRERLTIRKLAALLIGVAAMALTAWR
ncbi:MAG: hypothetical protein WCL44_11170 [bacterium]